MSGGWGWPDELDAVIAAPRHHVVLLENERVRVLDTRIEPGDLVPLHTHGWPSVYYVVRWSDFVRRDGDRRVLVDTRLAPKAGRRSALWAEPMPPHTLENVGAAILHVVSVELKEP